MDVAQRILQEGVAFTCTPEIAGGRPRATKAASRPRPAARSRAGSAVERWEAAVSARIEAGSSRAQAVRTLAAEQSELHAAYLQEINR